MMDYEPNPHSERIKQIKEKSISLAAKAGDLVRLNKEFVVAEYRDKNTGEPYGRMIARFRSISSPYQEFVVLSCGDEKNFMDCIDEVIVRGYQTPHPCFTSPCPIDDNHPFTEGK